MLPDYVHAILDEVETTLCLPIILLMVFCTAQLLLQHGLQTARTAQCYFNSKAHKGRKSVSLIFSLLNKFKGILGSSKKEKMMAYGEIFDASSCDPAYHFTDDLHEDECDSNRGGSFEDDCSTN